ncbi:M90 family metallopeptidase [Hydrotalea sp.]|uniref:M90 family metallopeptidase n=1 Tax=Hydrotalea sp. TaxID=2881279 RepID=UPI00260643F9|nr:M90 family metallopeptidase [Hydrotalea sp.]
MIGWILLIVVITLVALFIFWPRHKKVKPMPLAWQQLLQQHVLFYRQLNTADQKLFQKRVMIFLQYVHIHPVKTTLTDVDTILIASSAIIPIWGFPNWHYYNLQHILLYPNAFEEKTFQLEGLNRDVLGMVGTGTLNQMMILSQQSLREGFMNEHSKSNTAIHEFVHLLDKADGTTDGIPENLLEKPYVLPWVQLMHQTIQEMQDGKSDINIYGATNPAEFLAVVSEYFFSQPHLLAEHHPQLYRMLEKIFHQHPAQMPKPAAVSTGTN